MHLLGYQTDLNLIGNIPNFIINKKKIKVEYKTIIDNFIYYDCN